jgi:hypothetical protein
MIAPTMRARIIDPIIAAPVLAASGVDTVSHYGFPEPAGL